MDERGVFGGEKSDFDAFEERAREVFERVAEEIRDEYEEKSSFEQRVMFELIMPTVDERYSPGARHVKDLWDFKIEVSDDLVRDEINRAFNMETNCGGYALEVACPIFSDTFSLEEAKDNILKVFPFVREYDWRKLAPDEYLVLYRHEEGGCGHHFVKYSDGEFTDKCGCEPIKKFEGWPESYADWSKEDIFVVSRNHDMIVRDENGKRVWSVIV